MYMGMHTLADIVGGLVAASALLVFLIPLGLFICLFVFYLLMMIKHIVNEQEFSWLLFVC